MQAAEPNFFRSLKVWWAFFWRSQLLTWGLIFAAGIIVGIVAATFGARSERLTAIISTTGGIAAVPAFFIGSVQAMNWALRKKFSDFEIALLPRQD